MFRLIQLNLKSHPQLGDVSFSFTKDKSITSATKPFTSVIIGPNGTGKSYILRAITEIFRSLATLKEDKKKEPLSFDYHIKYVFNQNVFDIISKRSLIVQLKGKRSREIFVLKNYPEGTPIFDKSEKAIFVPKILNSNYEISIKELELPSKMLVSSIMMNDRFPFSKSSTDNFYQYLGIRRSSGTTSTKTFERKTISYLFDTAEIENFKSDLSDMLSFIGYENHLKIQYKTRYSKLFFSGELSKSEFVRFYEKWWESEYAKRKKDNEPWGKWYYDHLIKENSKRIEEIIGFLNTETKLKKYLKPKPRSNSFILDINFFTDWPIEDLKIIQELDKLDILEIEGIKIQKQTTGELSIGQTSSGEYHLILSLLGLYAKMTKSSLVLIDEPEISLHPNWQMQYIQFVKRMFRKFDSCHFIFATHSHFLISDLEGESSSIIGLQRNEKIESTLFDINTFGWSTEEVLYKIFNVKSVRNYFVERDLTQLLGMIGQNSEDITTIKQLHENLTSLPLSVDDPLNQIIKEVEHYIRQNDSKN
jgi:predicted ATPase